MKPLKQEVDELCKALTNTGQLRALTDTCQLIEAGWRSYELIVMNENAPDIQRKETRMAFFAGAQHLFGSIMVILEPGTEPTEKDLARVNQINTELRNFVVAFKLAHDIKL